MDTKQNESSLRDLLKELKEELAEVISEKEEFEDSEYNIRKKIEIAEIELRTILEDQRLAKMTLTATCDHCHVFSFEARQTDAGIFCPTCAEVTAAQIPAFLR